MPLRSKKQAFDEFKAGELHSGKGGPVVTNPKQAVAIALNVGKTKKKAKKKGHAAAHAYMTGMGGGY